MKNNNIRENNTPGTNDNKAFMSRLQKSFNELPDRLKKSFRQPNVWGFFVSMAVLAVVSIAFFYPDNFDGNTLAQHDMQQGLANGHEAQEYEAQTGEKALWTNSLFSGMPTFQIAPEYPSNSLFTWINSVYGLGLPAPSNLMFMMMFGFLIMLTCLRMRWWYALIGSLAWGLSSYFVIIIGAGHIWKFVALTYVPPTIGALVMIYQGRRIAGAAILSLFLMMELNANHPQITYYFAFVMALLVIGFLVRSGMDKKLKGWLANTGVTLCAVILAFGANLPSLYNTYEYSKETKRAASELTPTDANGKEIAQTERPTGGLPKSEIGGWSNLPEESFSLLIPNIKGGASIKPEKGVNKQLTLNNNEHYDYRMEDSEPFVVTEGGQSGTIPVISQFTDYFGGKGLTNGPFYVGALIVALFILGCFIVKGPVKWVLLFSTAISVMLAMGNHFEALTDFMIYNVPLYNKFRAAETALVIACLCMPLMGMLALQKLFSTPNALKDKQIQLGLSVAFVFPIFICFVAYVAPSVFGSPFTADEAEYLSKMPSLFEAQGYKYDPAQIQATVENIQNIRYAIISADAWRSLIVLVLGGGVVLLAASNRMSRGLACIGIGLIITIDLYTLDKRYVDHDSFAAMPLLENTIVADDADNEILNNDAGYYRVADLGDFGGPRRSYFHHMVGGYHAAKLNRYNDLLERIIYPALRGQKTIDSMVPVLSMLNTKYIIYPEGDGSNLVLPNENALGAAWLVDSIEYVENADAEMAALEELDPSNKAVADKRFKELLGDQIVAKAEGDFIKLDEYTPNKLTYTVNTKDGGLAVFSEVWFPWGWHATIDGEEVELGRVNYVLRALRVPAGKHTIVMNFDPQSLHVTSTIAYICITLIYLLCILAIFLVIVKREEENSVAVDADETKNRVD